MFSEQLKKVRQHKGLNQTELAKVFNVAKQTVSNWELGNRTPDESTLVRLADFFDVSLDYLLGRADNPNHSIIEGTLNGKQFEVTVESKTFSIRGVELTSDELEEFMNVLEKSFIDVAAIANKVKKS